MALTAIYFTSLAILGAIPVCLFLIGIVRAVGLSEEASHHLPLTPMDPWERKLIKWLIGVWVCLTPIYLGLWIFGTAIPSNSALVTDKGELVLNYYNPPLPYDGGRDPRQVVLWPLKPFWRRNNLVFNCSQQAIQQVLEIQPITDNPKVRNFCFKVRIESNGVPNDSLLLYRRYGKDWPATSWSILGYWLCEFREKNSRELAKLYNPHDARQQAKFQRMVTVYLEPLMKKEWGNKITIKEILFFDPLVTGG